MTMKNIDLSKMTPEEIAELRTQPVSRTINTKVKFLLERDETEVFAFFPEDDEGNGKFGCYAHIGQHSNCSLEYVKRCKEATREQSESLIKELESAPYNYEFEVLNSWAPNNNEGQTIAELIASAPELKAENERLKQELVNFQELYRHESKKSGEVGTRLEGMRALNAELLEALKAVYSDIDLDKHGSSELNIMVQSAIAKAEGKEQTNSDKPQTQSQMKDKIIEALGEYDGEDFMVNDELIEFIEKV